jgi:hypothetical protein
MNKRQFLGAAALAGAYPAIAAPPKAALDHTGGLRGPALLTVTGAIGKTNRPAMDPVRDQMMHKQKLSFDKAFAFDFAALSALPAIEIRPTLEFDGTVHSLRGPRMSAVLTAAGARLTPASKVLLRAVDGYATSVSMTELTAMSMIVATHLDGQPMALGGLGPLWAVYDADRYAPAAARPLAERFGNCPYALYHVDVSTS